MFDTLSVGATESDTTEGQAASYPGGGLKKLCLIDGARDWCEALDKQATRMGLLRVRLT